MNLFFKQYIHNFSQLSLFIILLIKTKEQISWPFIRDHKIISMIFNITDIIYFYSNSFQTKELNNKIQQLFQNFILE